MNNKGPDQTVRMHRLICTSVVHKYQKQVFSWRAPILLSSLVDSWLNQLINVVLRNYVSQPKGRGCICFWSRSCRHWCPRCFMSALCLLNQWVDFDQTSTDTLLGGGGGKKWLDFGDFVLIFKGPALFTPALWIIKFWPKKACLHPISWTKWQILAKLHTL